jgi:NAD(P)-dependent dehydrogenase (short-subunit alcohol dehydrogenase family)
MNVSSLAGRLGFSLRTPYASAKWGVVGLTKSLSLELGDDGIRVNALLPGIVVGERQQRVLSAKAQARGISFEEMEKLAFSFTSLKQYVTPQELADLVVFVASPRGNRSRARRSRCAATPTCSDSGRPQPANPACVRTAIGPAARTASSWRGSRTKSAPA